MPDRFQFWPHTSPETTAQHLPLRNSKSMPSRSIRPQEESSRWGSIRKAIRKKASAEHPSKKAPEKVDSGTMSFQRAACRCRACLQPVDSIAAFDPSYRSDKCVRPCRGHAFPKTAVPTLASISVFEEARHDRIDRNHAPRPREARPSADIPPFEAAKTDHCPHNTRKTAHRKAPRPYGPHAHREGHDLPIDSTPEAARHLAKPEAHTAATTGSAAGSNPHTAPIPAESASVPGAETAVTETFVSDPRKSVVPRLRFGRRPSNIAASGSGHPDRRRHRDSIKKSCPDGIRQAPGCRPQQSRGFPD